MSLPSGSLGQRNLPWKCSWSSGSRLQLWRVPSGRRIVRECHRRSKRENKIRKMINVTYCYWRAYILNIGFIEENISGHIAKISDLRLLDALATLQQTNLSVQVTVLGRACRTCAHFEFGSTSVQRDKVIFHGHVCLILIWGTFTWHLKFLIHVYI